MRDMGRLVMWCACCLTVVAILFANLAVCVADSPNPALFHYLVDIEGAKIISEGGYLWFHVTSYEPNWVSVSLSYPSDAITVGNVTSNVSLEADQSADFYFRLPYYWKTGHQQDSIVELRFNFSIYGPYHTPYLGVENVEFDVKVVPLDPKVDDQSALYLTVLVIALLIAATVVFVKFRRFR